MKLDFKKHMKRRPRFTSIKISIYRQSELYIDYCFYSKYMFNSKISSIPNYAIEREYSHNKLV